MKEQYIVSPRELANKGGFMKTRASFTSFLALSVFLAVIFAIPFADQKVMGYGTFDLDLAPTAELWQKTSNKTNWVFSKSEAGGLSVKNASGDITLVPADGDDIRIKAIRSDGDSEDVSVDVQKEGETVVGRVKYLARVSSVSVGFVIEAPPGLSVQLTSASGNIALDRYQGRVKVSTGSGNISLHDVDGEVHANTGSGRIEAYYTRPLQPTNNSALLSEIKQTWSYSITPGESRSNTNVINHPKLSGSGQRIFSSGSGRIVLNLASDLKADLFVEALSQKFQSDFGDSRDVEKRVRYSETINGGGPLIILSTGSGTVSVKRLGAQ
jgi:putative adhesin